MSYVFRFLVVVLAIACWASADPYVSSTKLCLFKGHPANKHKELVFWVEEKYNQYTMPFYKMSELGYSDFKQIKVALNEGSKAPALIYLYHNREADKENVAFVNYDKTAYHFSGSERLDEEKFKIVDGEKMKVIFGSCEHPEENWEYHVKNTTATIAGHVARPFLTP
ncbi:hypothetical protein V1525DRAFT_254012 [Lipomyces kononenkoae]|uniref:Uncharacterized protein n=1 Tax=Lipomyces kononenkoae TaxID=34357 RepID=A0ACC3SWI0_LIPKO